MIGLLVPVLVSLLISCSSGGRKVTETKESQAVSATSSSTELIPKAIILEREIRGQMYGAELSAPQAIRWDVTGNYYLIDKGNHRVLMFDSAFSPVVDFGGANRAGGRLRAPGRIAFDGRGNMFLADTELREIFQLDVALNLVRAIAFWDDTAALKFGTPGGLGVDQDGLLWVSDSDRSRLAIFDRFGIFKEFYADFNFGGSHFERPGAMFPLERGGMIVCDEGDGKALVFNSYGVQTGIIGKGVLREPVDIYLDRAGRIWICDRALEEVLCFDERGSLLFRTGDLGAAYNIKLTAPAGICITDDGKLIISDSGANRVLICKIIFSS